MQMNNLLTCPKKTSVNDVNKHKSLGSYWQSKLINSNDLSARTSTEKTVDQNGKGSSGKQKLNYWTSYVILLSGNYHP